MSKSTRVEEDAEGRYLRVPLALPALGIDPLPYASPDFPTQRDATITGFVTGIDPNTLTYTITKVLFEIDLGGGVVWRIYDLFPTDQGSVVPGAETEWSVTIAAYTLEDDSLYEFAVSAPGISQSVDLDTRPAGEPMLDRSPAKILAKRKRKKK